jgi:integrase
LESVAGGDWIVNKGSTYKRCGCRDPETGKKLGGVCPRLKRSNGTWNPNHGAWHYRIELPVGEHDKRRPLRRGSFDSQTAAQLELDQVRSLLAIPDGDDVQGLRQIADMIEKVTKRDGALPDDAEVRRRLQGGQSFAERLTVAAWLDQWLINRRKIKSTTRRGYDSHIRLYLKPYLGELWLDRLNVAHIQEMFDAIDERNDVVRAARKSDDPEARVSVKGLRIAGSATKQRIRATLRVALNAACRPPAKIVYNPAKYVELLSGKPPKALVWTAERVARWQRTGEVPSAVMVWTPEQTGSFLDSIVDDRLYALYHLIAMRGLRRGEGCGVHWTDLDADAKTLTVMWQIIQLGTEIKMDTPKSDAGARVIALDSETIVALRQHRSRQREEQQRWGSAWQDTGLVFTAVDGGPLWPNHVSNHFHNLIERAGLPPIRLHDLRHGAATIALAAGVDMKVVQEMLGHAVYSFTADTYTSVLPQLAHEAAESAARLVPRAGSKTEGHTSGTPEINSDSDTEEGGENMQAGSIQPGAPGATRTHTGRILSPLPLPIGLRGLGWGV